MDVQIEKLKLIEWLTGINDITIIEDLKAFRSQKESDWWLGLTHEQKEDIEAGLSDLEAGKKTEFELVLKKYN